MRKAIRVSLMIMVLACSANAGLMPNGDVSSPPPPPPAASANVFAEFAQSLLQTVLALI